MSMARGFSTGTWLEAGVYALPNRTRPAPWQGAPGTPVHHAWRENPEVPASAQMRTMADMTAERNPKGPQLPGAMYVHEAMSGS